MNRQPALPNQGQKTFNCFIKLRNSDCVAICNIEQEKITCNSDCSCLIGINSHVKAISSQLATVPHRSESGRTERCFMKAFDIWFVGESKFFSEAEADSAAETLSRLTSAEVEIRRLVVDPSRSCVAKRLLSRSRAMPSPFALRK